MPAIANIKQKARRTKAQIAASFKLISLTKYFDPFMDWMYGTALALAIFKDISDFVGLGSLPVIGTLITFGVSFTIGFIMFITGSGTKKRLARYGVLAVGTAVEMFFGLNFFPIESFMVMAVFYLTLRGRMISDMEKQMSAMEKDYPAEAEPAYN